MKRAWFFAALICLFLPAVPGRVFARQENPTPAPAAPAGELAIIAPLSGEALQGIAGITARAGGENFQSAEISFAYAGDTTDTWFLIHERSQPLDSDTPIEWDTSLITDGDYKLRLLVTYTDGRQQSVEVQGLRVRNYSAVETNTPAPTAAAAAATATPQAVSSEAAPPAQASPQPTQVQAAPATPQSTATPLPPPAPTPPPRNPAALPEGMVWLSLARGVLAAFGAFALVGLYELARRLGRR